MARRRAEMAMLVECLEAELSDRLAYFVAMRAEVGQLRAERGALHRGLELAEEVCGMHPHSVCAAEVLGLLRATPPEGIMPQQDEDGAVQLERWQFH